MDTTYLRELAEEGSAIHSEGQPEREVCDGLLWALAEIDRLKEHAVVLAATAELVERERCAEIAEKTVCDTHLPTGVRIYGTVAAKAIRGT